MRTTFLSRSCLTTRRSFAFPSGVKLGKMKCWRARMWTCVLFPMHCRKRWRVWAATKLKDQRVVKGHYLVLAHIIIFSIPSMPSSLCLLQCWFFCPFALAFWARAAGRWKADGNGEGHRYNEKSDWNGSVCYIYGQNNDENSLIVWVVIIMCSGYRCHRAKPKFTNDADKVIEPLKLLLPKFQLTEPVYDDSSFLISEPDTLSFRHDF